MKKINSIIIVGGGDAGLLTALSIRSLNSKIDITVIEDKATPTANVGKSTFHAFQKNLRNFLNIKEPEFIKEVEPIFKLGIKFQDYCERDFYYPFGHIKLPTGEHDLATYLYNNPTAYSTLEIEVAKSNKTPFIEKDKKIYANCSYAYHFEVEKLNEYLEQVCSRRGVKFKYGKIDKVKTDKQQKNITSIKSKTNHLFEADLYIDATGFNRILSSELKNNHFREFNNPLNKAAHVNIDRKEPITPATIIESKEYGWKWKIDTKNRQDIGIVFSDELTNTEYVKKSLSQQTDVTKKDINTIGFYTGYHTPAWQGNCISIGNANGFVEPIESTGLTIAALSARYLSKLLASHGWMKPDQNMRKDYNQSITNIWEDVWGFVLLHYNQIEGHDSEFWAKMNEVDPPNKAKHFIEKYNRQGLNMLCVNDDWDSEKTQIFSEKAYYLLLSSFNIKSDYYKNKLVDTNGRKIAEEIETENKKQAENHLTYNDFYNMITDGDYHET